MGLYLEAVPWEAEPNGFRVLVSTPADDGHRDHGTNAPLTILKSPRPIRDRSTLSDFGPGWRGLLG